MSITRGLKYLTQALVFNMAGERTKALEALANIARQANRILNQYDSGTSSEVENQLTTPSPTAQMASRSANTNSSATLRSSGSSESVTQALLRSFPSLAARGSSKRRSSSASRSKSASFASTCLCEITLPKTFKRKDDFFMSLEAVIDTNGKSFNCF